MAHQYLSFAVIALLLNMSPGPDLALLLRTALRKGRRQAFLVLAGVKSGALCWGLATVLGLSVVISSSPIAYFVIRLAGTAYLVYLGAGVLREGSRASAQAHTAGPAAAAPEEGSGFACWRTGFLNNILNPKVGVFYVAMVPQFVPRGVPYFIGGMSLSAIHIVVGLAWFGFVILGAERARTWLSAPRTARIIDVATGLVLIVVGVALFLVEI